MTRLMQKVNLAPLGKELALPLLVLALAVLVYGLYGFGGVLLRDYSIYLYSGQRMAEGVPPYVSVFDHKGPLAPMMAGLGVVLSKLFSSDDVFTVRLVFFATACLTAVAVYLLGKSAFRSQAAGFLGALTFLGFYAYAEPAASGPEPKTPMVLFEALSLWLTTQKRWFWAGVCGSLAFLVWQPTAAFPLVTFLLAVTRPGRERYRAALRAAAGIATPIVAIVAYFYYHGALGDLWDGSVLFNVLYLVRGGTDLATQVGVMVGVVAETYTTMLVPIVIGLGMILRLYFRRPFEYRFAPILLSLPAPVLWSLDDFQLSDDFFVFLPYAAVGFGAFLDIAIRRAEAPRLVTALLSAVLLAVALGNTLDWVSADAAYALKSTDITLSQQRQGALEIEERLGEDVKLASINSPQVLVLLHRVNPNPYLFITAGVDREIEAKTHGGFEGWLRGLESSTDAIAFFGEGQSLLPDSHLTVAHHQEIDNLLNPRYHAEKIGPWWLFVKDSSSTSEPDRKASIESRQEEGTFGAAG
jgi:hypothetical protein